MVKFEEIKKIAYSNNDAYKKALLQIIDNELATNKTHASKRFEEHFYRRGLAEERYSIRRDELIEMKKILSA